MRSVQSDEREDLRLLVDDARDPDIDEAFNKAAAAPGLAEAGAGPGFAAVVARPTGPRTWPQRRLCRFPGASRACPRPGQQVPHGVLGAGDRDERRELRRQVAAA